MIVDYINKYGSKATKTARSIPGKNPPAEQKVARKASTAAKIHKHGPELVFRHDFTTNIFQAGHMIRIGQELLSNKIVKTDMIYLHALN
jgi:site-specific recombinase XerD